MAVKLKFPILKNIDYIDVSRNKETKLTLNGSQANGMKWRDLQKLIGEKCGAGNYHYQLKQTTKDDVHVGMIKAIGGTVAPPVKSDGKLKALEENILSLSKKINSLSEGSGVSVDMLIQVTRQSYEMRISTLEGQLSEKKIEIVHLQGKLEDKEADVFELEEEIKSNSGFDKYFEIGKKILDAKVFIKSGKTPTLTNLEDSNPSDIPQPIIDSLGVVDWSQVESGKVNEIITYLNIFIPKLPMKGTGHG